jgi:hypothetical protein
MSASSTTQICPYCGRAAADSPGPCPNCGMQDTPTTRAATTARVGPWFVRQERNPGAPGMNFATLLSLVRKGQVTRESVVRGPTTQQLWTLADRVKGLSREFGTCWSCAEDISRGTNLCPHCQKLQEPPLDPNTLVEGKAPARERVGKPMVVGHSPTPPTGSSKQARILTPKELAAAFALEAPGNADALTAASSPESRSPERQRRPLRNAMVVTTLLLATGIGAYLWANAEARARVTEGLGEMRAWAESHLSEPAPTARATKPIPEKPPAIPAAHEEHPKILPAPRPPAPAPITPKATTAPVVSTPKVIPPTPAPKTTPPAPARRATVLVGPPTEVEKPATKAAPPPAIEPPAPTPEPEPAVETKEPVKPASGPPSAEDSRRAIDLFRQALEAESRNDYAGAVKLYDQIRELPQGAWPASLERRLVSAQLRAGDGG